MIQYAHDFMLSTICPDKKVAAHQINGSKNTIKSTNISDKDYIGMSNDSSVAYDIGVVKPNEKKTIDICIVLQEQPSNMSDFEKEIERVRRIDLHSEYTKTKSYSEIALAAGNKNAQRAVGNACNKNPIMIIIPCHRVVSKNNNLGGYAYGCEIKQKLLNIENGTALIQKFQK